MVADKILVSEQANTSYEAQMSALRIKLAGRPYCKAVGELLPGFSKATIHGAVNGRNQNEMVLTALKIVVFKLDKEQEKAQEHLAKAAQAVGFSE
jgi:hypothetical protein